MPYPLTRRNIWSCRSVAAPASRLRTLGGTHRATGSEALDPDTLDWVGGLSSLHTHTEITSLFFMGLNWMFVWGGFLFCLLLFISWGGGGSLFFPSFSMDCCFDNKQKRLISKTTVKGKANDGYVFCHHFNYHHNVTSRHLLCYVFT